MNALLIFYFFIERSTYPFIHVTVVVPYAPPSLNSTIGLTALLFRRYNRSSFSSSSLSVRTGFSPLVHYLPSQCHGLGATPSLVQQKDQLEQRNKTAGAHGNGASVVRLRLHRVAVLSAQFCKHQFQVVVGPHRAAFPRHCQAFAVLPATAQCRRVII